MLNGGYWLNKNGILFDVTNSTHIDFIIKNPELFDLTFDKIKEIYKKYGEENELNRQRASEGKQREELIKSVYSQGWIRIRFYKRRGWILQTDSIKERQGLIKSFLKQQSGEGIKLVKYGNEITKSIMSPYDNVFIQDLEGNQKSGEIRKIYNSLYESKLYENYIFLLFDTYNHYKKVFGKNKLKESNDYYRNILDLKKII